MSIRKFLSLTVFVFIYNYPSAQELQAKVTVVASRVNSTIDKKVFQSLQTQLTNFLNTILYFQELWLRCQLEFMVLFQEIIRAIQ